MTWQKKVGEANQKKTKTWADHIKYEAENGYKGIKLFVSFESSKIAQRYKFKFVGFVLL